MLYQRSSAGERQTQEVGEQQEEEVESRTIHTQKHVHRKPAGGLRSGFHTLLPKMQMQVAQMTCTPQPDCVSSTDTARVFEAECVKSQLLEKKKKKKLQKPSVNVPRSVVEGVTAGSPGPYGVVR